MKKVPEWAKACLRKEKEGLKPTKHEKTSRWKKDCRKKEREMIKTYKKQRRKDASFLTSIFHIFTLSCI